MRIQSALDSAGSQASAIEGLWWIFFWVAVAVYVSVVAALMIALFRKRRDSPSDKAAVKTVTIATAITVVTLFGLLISSIVVGREIAGMRQGDVTIKVTGYRWWWDVEYQHPEKNKTFRTANELYIPVGVPVRVELRTGDVIHSFWVPNLHGKQDLINGVPGVIFLKADKPGTWRGQCAEFCGQQHAKMAFWVTAVPQQEFARWWQQQVQPSRIPATPDERKGQETFMSSPCPLCHSITGTDAAGKTAPDLTHFASRRSIAAATLPNRREFLADWIVDSQHVKPGNNMPPVAMQSSDLNPLLAYLESLE